MTRQQYGVYFDGFEWDAYATFTYRRWMNAESADLEEQLLFTSSCSVLGLGARQHGPAAEPYLPLKYVSLEA